MRFNALPFLFLPGVVLVGHLFGGRSGVIWAVTVWGGIVLIGTLLNLRRHFADREKQGKQRDDRFSVADSQPAVSDHPG